MTTRKRFVVSRGDKVEVVIPTTRVAQPEKEKKKGVIPYDEADDLYVFRKNDVFLHFYEIDENDAYHYGTDDMQAFPNVGPTLEKYQEIDAACLAALASNQVSALIAGSSELPMQTYTFSQPASPFGLSSTRLFRQSAPYGQFHYDEDDQREVEKGSNIIRFKAPALQNKGSFRAGDNLFWRQFDSSYDPDFPSEPGDSGFKITDEPSFSAPRVDVAINGGHVNVFLKRLPRAAEIIFNAHFYVPYRWWNADNIGLEPLQPNITQGGGVQTSWKVGIPTDVHQQFESFHVPNLARSFALHWNAKINSEHVIPQKEATTTTFNDEADDYLDRMLDNDNEGGSGYVWFSGAYGPGWTQAERDAIPRFYEGDDHGFFLHEGFGRIKLAAWSYQGEFCGAFDYKDRRYYVWRYTNSGNSTFAFPQAQIWTFNVSNSGWELEPGFIWTSEVDGDFNPTSTDLHYVEDETRDQFFFVDNPHLTGNVDFISQPKFSVDLVTKPRNYQS